MYNIESWIEYHGKNVLPEDYEQEYKKWLDWRLAVDRGMTKSEGMVIVKGEIGYESPATGKIITSEKARKEDLARSGCIEYDPEMRADYRKRIEESDKKLDKQFDEVIDKTLAQMPSDKRAKLDNELAGGLDISVDRLTA